MMRILALAAATFFLALTSGCKKDSEENARSANISFSELAGEGFFFTDTQGVLRFRRNDGSLSTVKREDHAFLTDVDASSDGATVVVTRKPWDRSQKSEILIYRAKGVELTEEKRVLGEVARIAGDGETVFF